MIYALDTNVIYDILLADQEFGPSSRDFVNGISLDDSLEFIADDELLEVTPKNIRIRKSILDNSLRAKTRAKEK